MKMTPGVRKLALTAHVTITLGWLGAVIVFLALAVVGLTSQHSQTVRGAYLVMEPTARFVLVPLAFASLLSGLVQSLGTTWGLFRHYWVVIKLAMVVLATFVLLTYMETFSLMASVAADLDTELGVVRNPSPVLHAALALVVLLVAAVLGVYKPRGVTGYGLRKLREASDARDATGTGRDRWSATGTPRWVKVFGIIAAIIFVKFLILMFVRGPGGH